MAARHGAELEEELPLAGLEFNEPLSWRAGKPIPTGELLRRLDTLSNELREMDQEETDKDSLTHVAKELAAQNLLNHKDKGVRAFTACCLVDVLKICAPDAPFTPTQLKAIFTLFVTTILPALSDPSNAYNTQHKYVLASLAEVKSIVLLVDIPGSDNLLLHIFSSFFDTISGSSKASTGESIAKDVEFNMTQILVTLVDESQVLSQDVVDVIMAQFLRASSHKGKHGEVEDKQTTLLVKELPEAYNMARTICNSCPEKMARYVSQYFNDVILEVSGGAQRSNGHRRMSDGAGDSEDEETPAGPTETDLKELSKAHELLKELWRASPAVLQNVIPQLEAELSAQNVQLRVLATETLGDIISGIGSAGPPPPPPMDPAAYPQAKLDEYPQTAVSDSMLTTPMSPQSFAQTHPGIYHSFLSRRNDKSLVIRSGWTTAIGRILVTSAGGIGLSRDEESSLVQGLGEKLNDVDEKVRLAAVRAIGQFGFHNIMAKLAPNGGVHKSGSVLCSLADRARDRKYAVRVEAMTLLGKIWGVASGEIAAGNYSVKEALGEIPRRIYDAYYANDKEVNVLLDHVTFEQLIPLNYPPSKPKATKAANGESQSHSNGDTTPFDADKIRTERILLLVSALDPRSKKAFFAMQARQTSFSSVLEIFLKRCEEYNGGVTDKDSKDVKSKLDTIIKYLGDFLPDPLRLSVDLHKYAKLHDRRSYQLLRFAMSPASDFGTVYKAIKEFRKRIENAPGAPAGILETLNPIIFRSSCLIYNRSHQPVIMQFSRTDENGLGATANEVMKEISEKLPQIFQASVKELCKSLEEQAPSKGKSNDPGSVETLKALASFVKSVDHKIPSERKFIQALVNFALYGTPPKAAKYAVSILVAATNRKEMHMKDLLEKSMQGWTYGEDHFLSKLATISQLTLMDPKLTEDCNDEILDITTQQVLLQTRTPLPEKQFDWQSDADIDKECQAKCWAIKTLVNRLRTTTDVETAKKLAIPVFKLLNALIVKSGELSKNNDTPDHHKSRLRLLAAQQMLKICTIKMLDELVSPVEFNRLAFVAQDPIANVRRGFIEKLQKYLVKGRLSNRFLTIIFLTAYEPNVEFKNSIMTWIRSRVQVYRENKNRFVESVFPRLIHLLAHHPDYSVNPDELLDNARYILYYLQTVVSEDNIALIYKYAERVKGTRNAIPGADPDALYVLSDLAQSLIKKWEEKKGWSMQTWPTKVGMPVGLFAAMPSHEVALEIAQKNYLPDEMDDLLDNLVKNSERKKISKLKRKTTDDGDDDTPHTSKKAKSEHKSRPPKKERVSKTPKEKKTPKPKKRKEFSSPALDSADRRKSMRASITKKGVTYADRDSSEDDEEMLDGVAQWEWEDENDEEGKVFVGKASEDEDEDAMSGVEEEGEKEKSATLPSPSLSPPPAEQEEEVESSVVPEETPALKGRGRAKGKATPKSSSKVKKTPLKPKSATKSRSKAAPEPEPESDAEAEVEVEENESSPLSEHSPEPEQEPELDSEPEPQSSPVPKSKSKTNGRKSAASAKAKKPATPAITKEPSKRGRPSRGKAKEVASEPEPEIEAESEPEVEAEVEVESILPSRAKAKGKGKGKGKKNMSKEVVVESEEEGGADADVEAEPEEAEAEVEEEEEEPVEKSKGKRKAGKPKKAVVAAVDAKPKGKENEKVKVGKGGKRGKGKDDE